MQRPVHDWVLVKIAGRKTSALILPDGVRNQVAVYVTIEAAGPLAKIEDSGVQIGNYTVVPRIVAVPGLPKGCGMVKTSDIFYVMDALPEGVEPEKDEDLSPPIIIDTNTPVGAN